MSVLAYKIVNLFLLFVCGVLIVLLFFDDGGRYCIPVSKAQELNSGKYMAPKKDTMEYIP